MNCVILDDEPLAVELLSQYVAETENLSLSFATTDAFAAIQFIQKNEVDIIFLDVQMPELSGIQVLKIIGNNYKVIFTTAYTDYALDGYEYNITDYLLKPITQERFLKAVDKALATGIAAPLKSTGIDNDFIFIKSDSKMIKVNLNEILFIEGLKDYISIQTTKEKLITLQNLKALEQHLSGTQFMRVHKSYIVALNKIDTIEKNRIFIGSEVIPIGETYRDIFLKRIEGNKL
ncbi:LytR/AlgR family response regulator transcription factor [Ferruginibacter sp. SUN106]|uniref:LytR/AlgR family response regulator transcription factor n=1 Tax=Ferruginibacter sp. SUN106 TaxID=2978348 RepID=UPI003D35EAD7